MSRLAYLPLSLGLFVGRLLHLSVNGLFYAGVISGLLFYMVLLALAAIICPHLRNIILMIGILPTSLFFASVYTYDSFLIYMTLFGMALMMEEYFRDDTVRIGRFVASVALILIGCIPKEIYIFLVIPWLLFDRAKFASVRQRRIVRLVTVVVLAVGLASFVVPALVGVSGGADHYTDYRNEGTNMSEQIRYVLGDPIGYAKLLVFCIYRKMDDFLFGSTFGLLGYLGRYVDVFTRGYFFLILAEGLTMANHWGTNAEKPVMSVKMRIAILCVIAIIIAMIWSVMYVSFTPVGADYIDGVQARYYLPLMFPICFLFFNNKIQLKCDINKYNKVIMGIMMLLCVICMFGVLQSH